MRSRRDSNPQRLRWQRSALSIWTTTPTRRGGILNPQYSLFLHYSALKGWPELESNQQEQKSFTN